MPNFSKRIVIYAKDIENITGRSRRTSYTILQKIRKYYNKLKNEFITIQEFCEFMKIREELVRDLLND